MLFCFTDIDAAYPESYSATQLALAEKICEYLDSNGQEYDLTGQEAIEKFVRDMYGIAVEYGWGYSDRWAAVTRDMAYDEYARQYCA